MPTIPCFRATNLSDTDNTDHEEQGAFSEVATEPAAETETDYKSQVSEPDKPTEDMADNGTTDMTGSGTAPASIAPQVMVQMNRDLSERVKAVDCLGQAEEIQAGIYRFIYCPEVAMLVQN